MIPATKPQTTDQLAARPLSRLSYQIMGLNLMAVIILIAGVFYLDQYKKDITVAETEILATETRLYSSIVSDNAVSIAEKIDSKTVEKLFDTFGEQKPQRIRFFDRNGNLLVDTRTSDNPLASEIGKVLPGFTGSVLNTIYDSISDMLSINFSLPRYPVTSDESMNSFPGTKEALTGISNLSAWQSPAGGLILSAAAPVKKSGKIIGVLLVTRSDTKIEHTFGVMRLSAMKFFLFSILCTLCFSLYLSAYIGHPLRKLATAAEAVRLNRGGVEIIPDMSSRDDEIGELSISLRKMTGELQDRIDSIERFAADVSHELKNPLTSMRSAVETLEKVKKDEDRHTLMRIVMHDLVRMDRLISDISKASRLDVELLRDVYKPVDLRTVILPLLDAYRKPLDRENSSISPHNIIIHGLDHPVTVLGHAGRLTQVFENLISNALSFSPTDKPVEISVKEGPDFINITVDDEGPGIPENRLGKIFERFYTERPQSEGFGSHSGLGLSIVKQIIIAHGGGISAQNRYDANGNILGARFLVRFKPAEIKS